NNADTDDDNDGVPDSSDAFPTNPAEYLDSDSDGIGDNSDSDDDNDGVPDINDTFPTNSAEHSDLDGDGIGDNSDLDIDGDGWSTTIEETAGSDPEDYYDVPSDTDSDGVGDNADLDDDNDGVPDYEDYSPLDKNVRSDPNLIRIMGVEFEVGELVMGVMMAIAMAFFGTFVFTRKKRLYNKHKHNIENCKSVKQLNAVNSEIKLDMEKEHLTSIQLTMLKEQFDEKFMSIRQKELERKLGRLPSKVEDSVREIISDKIITQEEFTGMQRWLARLKDSKDFDTGKKEKLQGVLRDWIDENIVEDWDVMINKKK
ncbi:thrombospondin type 3 repeat-containing protein, partial [bacterium]|nr:thrombospondin type 3 repeat-containing protein [bacterium]